MPVTYALDEAPHAFATQVQPDASEKVPEGGATLDSCGASLLLITAGVYMTTFVGYTQQMPVKSAV